MTCCAAALGRLWDCWSKLTVAKATVAFPLISAGAFGWPQDDAVRQAVDTIRAAPNDGIARLVLWQSDTYDLARSIAAS